jgi:hypothetical protein
VATQLTAPTTTSRNTRFILGLDDVPALPSAEALRQHPGLKDKDAAQFQLTTL